MFEAPAAVRGGGRHCPPKLSGERLSDPSGAQHMKLSSYLQVMKTTDSQANMQLRRIKYEAEDI
jgi:hypothetical protein